MPAPVNRGSLKIYFGYAPGVGKTFQMLEDARDLKSRGVDVVVGALDAHDRQDVAESGEALEHVALMRIAYRGGSMQEMDVDAILKRAPHTCVVDELAHVNAPGSPRARRWEDVHALLRAGIDVLTTMNVQNL